MYKSFERLQVTGSVFRLIFCLPESCAGTLLLKTTLEECDPAVATQIRDAALVEGIVLRHFFQAIFDPSYDQRCVSRYLISLWMSHHAPSKRLLTRMIPAGFLPFLSEPAVSASELEELDNLEVKALELERESFHDLHEDNRLSFLSDSTNPEELFGVADELRFSDSDGPQTRGVHARSISAGELNLSPSLIHAGSRRQSVSHSRSSLSDSSRSSVSWISATVRESQQHTQIENNHTKARMLQKLQSSTTKARNGDSARAHFAGSNGAPRVRKRDIALGFISGSLLKSKSEKLMTRRPNKALKASSSHSVMLNRRQENFRLLFFMLSRDHEEVDLIWNRATREELRRALFTEIERFSKHQVSHGNGKALWNCEDFQVHYASLASELVIGGCYVRILSNLAPKSSVSVTDRDQPDEEDRFVALPPEDVPVRDPKLVIASLYRRILRENIRAEFRNDLELSLLCLKSLTIVSAAHASPTDATDFEEIDYLTTLMTETVHASILEGLRQALRALCLYGPNAKRFALHENSVETVVKMLQMAHTLNREAKVTDSEKLWILESFDGDTFGPLSVDDFKEEQARSKTKDLSQFWVRRRSDPVSQHSMSRTRLMENMQLRWEIGINGSISPLQMAHDAVSILLAAARSNSLLSHPNAVTSAETGAGGLFPAPQAKCVLWGHTRKIISLLLRRETPQLCHKVAVLLELLYSDELSITRSLDERAANRSSLFFWGLFFMAFVVDSGNFVEIAGLLQSTHLYQSGFGGKSALTEILPDAMIERLSAVSAREFSEVFCSEVYSPSVVWSQRMRRRLQDSCLAHLQDFITVLEEDVTSEWKFCHMAPMTFSELEDDVWCGGVYLGRFCAADDYPVKSPLEFMHQLSFKWRAEVGRRSARFDTAQAATHLGLNPDVGLERVSVIREGFRQKAMELEAEVFSSADYDQR